MISQQANLLIVDDEKHTREGLRACLEDDFEVYVASNLAEAYELLKMEHMDLVITDLRLAGDDGIELVEYCQKMKRPPVVIMMTAYGSVETAVKAMKHGAYHFITKPLHLDEVELLVKRALRGRSLEIENEVLQRQVDTKFSVEGILGQSEVMVPILDTVKQVASTKATVLIEGESGTGKELIAKAIHHLSGRPKDKLVTVHCAALSPQLLESELFGHEKGSFTGAQERRIGRLELANQGTLFLDEIGEIDASTQVKLLRALGEQVIERVGSNKTIPINVRIIAATNRNLAKMVADGKFREDLYWRLRVVTLFLPPLRERKSDIIILAEHFLKDLAKTNQKAEKKLTEEAMSALYQYDWPGNIRELRMVIEHGVVMSRGHKISLIDLPKFIVSKDRWSTETLETKGKNTAPQLKDNDAGFENPLDLVENEKKLILKALERSQQNRTAAAILLNIDRRTLQRKLKEMGIKKFKK